MVASVMARLDASGLKDHARIDIERRIVGAQRQIPAVEFAQLRTGLKVPDVALRFGMHHRRDISAHAEIVATKKPEHVGDGGFAPSQIEYAGRRREEVPPKLPER